VFAERKTLQKQIFVLKTLIAIYTIIENRLPSSPLLLAGEGSGERALAFFTTQGTERIYSPHEALRHRVLIRVFGCPSTSGS